MGIFSPRNLERQLRREHKAEVLIHAYQNETAILSKMDFKSSLISHQDLPHVFWLAGLDDRNIDGTLGCEMPLMAVQRTLVKAYRVWPCKWVVQSFIEMLMLSDELWACHLPPLFMDYGLICCLILYFQAFPQCIPISLCSSLLSFSFYLSHSFYSLQILAWENVS